MLISKFVNELSRIYKSAKTMFGLRLLYEQNIMVLFPVSDSEMVDGYQLW